MKTIVVFAATLAPAALSQVSPVAPFTGPFTESFETQPAMRDVLYSCLPGRIFNNRADICESENGTLVLPLIWVLFCQASPHTGQRYIVALERPIDITFDDPATRFGGYFATIGGSGGGTAEFYDAAGSPIGSAPIATSNCTYIWSGWESAVPFRRVRLVGLSPFSDGGYLHMDDLEFRAGNSASCYPNCDASTTSPILNVQDFSCFLNRFAAGDTYANCDASTTPPILNVQDFACFLNSFGAGCS